MAYSKALILNLTVLFFITAIINLGFNGANAQDTCSREKPCPEDLCCVSSGGSRPKTQCTPLAEEGQVCAYNKLASGRYLNVCPCKQELECKRGFSGHKCKATATKSTN